MTSLFVQIFISNRIEKYFSSSEIFEMYTDIQNHIFEIFPFLKQPLQMLSLI